MHCNTFSFYLRFGPGSKFPTSSSLLCVCHNTLCVWFEKLTCSFQLTLIWYFMLQCRLLLMTRVVTHKVDSGPEPPARTLIFFFWLIFVQYGCVSCRFVLFPGCLLLLTHWQQTEKTTSACQLFGVFTQIQRMVLVFSSSVIQRCCRDFHYFNRDVFLCT